MRDPVEAMWRMVGGAGLITPDHISRWIMAAISEDGARVLLDLLTRPEARRVTLMHLTG